MKKRLLSTLLALCVVLTLLPGVARAVETSGKYKENIAQQTASASSTDGTVSAIQSSAQVYLNDSSISISGYVIGGNTYYKLRDLAYALRDTTSCFDVEWNAVENQVEVYTQQPYSGEKDDSQGSWWIRPVKAAQTKAQLTVDGRAVDITAYNVDGNNYYKLRDMGELLSFSVYWLEESRSICLYTLDEHTRLVEGTAGSTRKMSTSVSTARWSHVFRSYLYQDGNSVYVVDGSTSNSDAEDVLAVDVYDVRSFALLESRQIPKELELFGGFFAGETYNYAIFGQSNTEENNRKEVIRIVKYSKDFERLDSASITGGESYTTVPFDAGSLRIAENGNELVIHTSRERYTTADGLNHQSQLTIRLDTDSMRVKNDMGRFQANHVSHSLNQFALFDGGNLILLDHGDAYPRSIVLNRLNGNSYSQIHLLKIPGKIGANCTGVTVGGFEASSSNYIAAINTIDHSKVTAYDSYSMTGLDRDERDIVLLVCQKDGAGTKTVKLTDYIGKGMLGSTPYLVKLSDDRFLVLWEEFSYGGASYGAASQGVRYVEVDGTGQVLTEVQILQNAWLSFDCQPVLLDDAVTWYVNMKVGRMFYQIGIANQG